MNGLALALAMFTASGPSHSHFVDPFDLYIAGVKSRQPNKELTQFAAECGVPVSGAASKYALGGGTWQPVPNLPSAIRELESDYFSTVQVWKSGPHLFIISWGYDLEQEYRTSYCFEQDGSLAFEDVRAWIFELPSGTGWSFIQRWTLDSDGKPHANKGSFSNMRGMPIVRPKLDDEQRKSIDFREETRNVKELQLPKALLQ